MRRSCRIVAGIFAAAYVFGLAMLATGTFGLFGNETDPLAGIFLMPLGMPWNLAIDVFPEPLWPWLAAAAPAINIVIVWAICRALSARQAVKN